MVTKRWVGRWTNHNAQRKPPPNVSHTMYHSHTQCITYTCITHSTQNVSHTSHKRYHTYVSHTHKMYNTCTTQNHHTASSSQQWLHDPILSSAPFRPRHSKTHFQLPSLSSRSEDLEVSSTWNRSMSILMIRAWMVIPRCRTTTTTADYVQQRNTFQPRQTRTK